MEGRNQNGIIPYPLVKRHVIERSSHRRSPQALQNHKGPQTSKGPATTNTKDKTKKNPLTSMMNAHVATSFIGAFVVVVLAKFFYNQRQRHTESEAAEQNHQVRRPQQAATTPSTSQATSSSTSSQGTTMTSHARTGRSLHSEQEYKALVEERNILRDYVSDLERKIAELKRIHDDLESRTADMQMERDAARSRLATIESGLVWQKEENSRLRKEMGVVEDKLSKGWFSRR